MGVKGYPWMYLDSQPFLPAEIQMMVDHMIQHQDASSFQLIYALKEIAPEQYGSLPNKVKASILSAGIASQATLNDWGPLSNYSSHALAENEADSSMAALVATGEAALPHLLPLLNDKRPGYFSGSKEATTSTERRYRRCDFAHRAAALILGESYLLKKDLGERDRDIESIRQRVRQRIAVAAAVGARDLPAATQSSH
jgi:hypothetical protein